MLAGPENAAEQRGAGGKIGEARGLLLKSEPGSQEETWARAPVPFRPRACIRDAGELSGWSRDTVAASVEGRQSPVQEVWGRARGGRSGARNRAQV